MLVTEFPENVIIDNDQFNLEIQDPKSGMIFQEVDNLDSLTFTLESAVEHSFSTTNTCFLTFGNSPGYTIGLKKENRRFYVMDSHSRDDSGLCVPSGKAVVLQLNSAGQLVKYIKDMCRSISERNVQFEMIPCVINQLNTEQINETNEPERRRPSVEPEECRPSVEPEQHRPSVEPAQRRPSVESEQRRLSVEPEQRRPSVEPEQRRPSVEPEQRCPSFEPEQHRPSVEPEQRRPSVEHEQRRPSFEPEQRRPSTNSEQHHPRIESEMNSPSVSEPMDSQVSSHNTDQQQATVLDIGNIDNISTLTDDVKYHFIRNRVPEASFHFPAKVYKDSRCKKTGFFKRTCSRDWFTRFDFICYSKSKDGLYCLACKFFPDESHRRPKKMVSEPYRNWKDAMTDLKHHASCDYHINSVSRLSAFRVSYLNPGSRIDVNLTSGNDERIAKNRSVLKSLVKCLEFCGRRGMALRGHRDDDKTPSENPGNFKSLVEFRVESGDSVLRDHLKTCQKNASYTSKTSQNELLLCIKKYIQSKVVEEVKNQPIGPYFGFQCDEVTDTSNWEQLGLVLRYTVDGTPTERLLEFIPAEDVKGETLCNLIVRSLTDAGLDIQDCRSQTMDGAGNMAGKNIGCAAQFSRLSPKAVYHYCASHNLNLVLCNSCKVTEIHLMLDSLKQLGIFFKFSPKRTRRLEEAVDAVNANRREEDKITKTKFKVFCETRWTEKHTTLESFFIMYDALISCIEAISSNEGRSWDRKAILEANGLHTKTTDSTFIISFQTVRNFFGYVSGLSKKLQGSALDITQGYKMVDTVKEVIESTREDKREFETVFEKATAMSEAAGVGKLSVPRRCARQTNRSNVPADTEREYFKRAIFLPFWTP